MRFSFTYAAMAAMSSVYLSSVGAQTTTSTCWAPASNVAASYGPLSDLRIDANLFCTQFASGAGVVSSAGKYVFGFQSASFQGSFSNNASCLSTFNSLVTDCYGTASPTRPVTLGGARVDPGGAQLTISFGTGVRL